MVFDRAVLFRGVPARALGVFGADRRRPGQAVVDLDKIVVSQHGVFGSDATEEVQHAFFQLRFEPGDVARSVDFRQRHTELVFEPPEACEQDGACQEVVLAVGLLEHDRQVVLDQAGAEGHGIFCGVVDGQVRWPDVESFAREEVVEADGGAGEHLRVAFGQVGCEFFEELQGGGMGSRVRGVDFDAFGAARGEALGFFGVEAQVFVVELDPIVPVHAAEAEVDAVFWPVAEWAVGEGRGIGGGPVGVWWCFGTLEVAGFPGFVGVST